jgi:hypothetical protein
MGPAAAVPYPYRVIATSLCEAPISSSRETLAARATSTCRTAANHPPVIYTLIFGRSTCCQGLGQIVISTIQHAWAQILVGLEQIAPLDVSQQEDDRGGKKPSPVSRFC